MVTLRINSCIETCGQFQCYCNHNPVNTTTIRTSFGKSLFSSLFLHLVQFKKISLSLWPCHSWVSKSPSVVRYQFATLKSRYSSRKPSEREIMLAWEKQQSNITHVTHTIRPKVHICAALLKTHYSWSRCACQHLSIIPLRILRSYWERAVHGNIAMELVVPD